MLAPHTDPVWASTVGLPRPRRFLARSRFRVYRGAAAPAQLVCQRPCRGGAAIRVDVDLKKNLNPCGVLPAALAVPGGARPRLHGDAGLAGNKMRPTRLPGQGLEDPQVMSLENEWLTTEEAARYLKVNRETLRRWARRGLVPAVKFGNRGGFRFKREDLDRFTQATRV